MHEFLKFIFGMKLYTFQAVPLSIIRSFSLYTQQWYGGQRNCPKHVQFHSKIKFEKLVHLVDFVIRRMSTLHICSQIKLVRIKLQHMRFPAPCE